MKKQTRQALLVGFVILVVILVLVGLYFLISKTTSSEKKWVTLLDSDDPAVKIKMTLTFDKGGKGTWKTEENNKVHTSTTFAWTGTPSEGTIKVSTPDSKEGLDFKYTTDNGQLKLTATSGPLKNILTYTLSSA